MPSSTRAHSINTALMNSVKEKERSHWKIPDEVRPILNLLIKKLGKHCRQASIIRQMSKKLLPAVTTRWNSNVWIIDSIVQVYEIVEVFLAYVRH